MLFRLQVESWIAYTSVECEFLDEAASDRTSLAMTSARVQVQLVDPNDTVRSSAETEVQLKPGTNHVGLELRGWKQKSEEWNDSIWYRLCYRVTIPPAESPSAEGILDSYRGQRRFEIARDLRPNRTSTGNRHPLPCLCREDRLPRLRHAARRNRFTAWRLVDRNSLEKAMNGSEWNISQYEIRPDRVVAYLWPKAGGMDFAFTFRERYEVNALTAPSVLYDYYYNPDAQTVVRPARIDVRETRLANR